MNNIIEFRGRYDDTRPTTNNEDKQIKSKTTAIAHYGSNPSEGAKRNQDGDSYESARELRNQRREAAQKRKKFDAWKNRIIGAVLALTIVNGGKTAVNNITAPHANYDTTGHTITQVAEFNGVDPQAIIIANKYKMEDKDSVMDKVILPVKYDIYGEQADKIREELNSEKITPEEKEEKLGQLQMLAEKQEAADKVALSYTDENKKWLYIVPNPDGEESPYLEDIKEIYGLKDGVIIDYNSNIKYVWNFADENDTKGFRDYRYSHLPAYGIKVPYNEIGKTFDKK